jgi:hypothetical protein
MPVGKFNPALNTETVKPGGTTMSLPLSGANKAVLSGHNGFMTVGT